VFLKPVNGNPYDLRKENQEITKKKINLDPNSERETFLRTTCEYMEERNVALRQRGIEPKDYWEMVNLPPIVKSYCLSETELLSSGPVEKNDPDDMDFEGKHAQTMMKMKQMHIYGYSWTQMAQMLDLPLHRVRYLIKKLKAGNHI
jgi:hypothetical protein